MRTKNNGFYPHKVNIITLVRLPPSAEKYSNAKFCEADEKQFKWRYGISNLSLCVFPPNCIAGDPFSGENFPVGPAVCSRVDAECILLYTR